MFDAQEAGPLAPVQEAAWSPSTASFESVGGVIPVRLPFAHLTKCSSIVTTELPKRFLSKHLGITSGKGLQRSEWKMGGVGLSKGRRAASVSEPDNSSPRSKTPRKKQSDVRIDASRRLIEQGFEATNSAGVKKHRQCSLATLSLSHAALGGESIGVAEGARTWHRADFVFEDELSKGPDVQWFRLRAQLKVSGPRKEGVVEKRRNEIGEKKQVRKRGKAERQAQIADELEKLGKRSGLLQQLASGAFAGVVSRSFVAPLDLIKTHLVTGHGSRGAAKSAATVAANIYQEGGWKGFFRGNGINCLRVAPCKAIELCVFENLKRALSKDEKSPLSIIAAPVAGGAAGMMSTVATYPLELMRTRMMVQPHLYTSISRTFNKIVAEEGLGALYSGLRPSVLGVFPYAAANYGVYAALRSAYKKFTKKDYVPTIPTLLFGAASASASSALTFPLEVARRQMQLGTVGGKAVYKNALDVVQTIYAEEGFYALYRGLGTTCVKLIPAAAVSCMCYEAARLALRVDDASIKKRENEKEALKEEEEVLALQAEE